MKDDLKAAIRTALKEFDDRVAFAWRFAEVEFDHDAYLPQDPAPAKLVEHYREKRDFTVEFAGKFEGARRTLTEVVNAALAEAPMSDERRWQNFCVSFQCFDDEMAASWKALEIVLDHYDAHPPDDPAKLAQHYREMTMFSVEFARRLGRERRDLGEYEAAMAEATRSATRGQRL